MAGGGGGGGKQGTGPRGGVLRLRGWEPYGLAEMALRGACWNEASAFFLAHSQNRRPREWQDPCGCAPPGLANERHRGAEGGGGAA